MNAKRLLTSVIVAMMVISVFAAMCASATNGPGDEPVADHGADFGATGDHIKMGVDSHGYLADFTLGYGLQYPVGIEHLAISWWGEGYTVGYKDPADITHLSYAYASDGVSGLTFVSETPTETADEANVVDVAVTTDNRLQITTDFLLPKHEKFVILDVTLRNIGADTITDLVYKRTADWDLDNSVGGDTFDYLGDEGYPIVLANDDCYAGFATSSYTPSDLHDCGWDTYWSYSTTINNPDPDGMMMDGCGVFVFEDDLLAPGECVIYRIYYIFGDDKDEVLSGYNAAELYKPPPVCAPPPSVPAMTPIGIAALVGLLGLVGTGIIMRRREPLLFLFYCCLKPDLPRFSFSPSVIDHLPQTRLLQIWDISETITISIAACIIAEVITTEVRPSNNVFACGFRDVPRVCAGILGVVGVT
jgi:hypothetical protein